MGSNDFEIRFVDSWSEDEIVEFYRAGGWWKESYDKSLINSMIAGSFVFAVVIDSKIDKAIGMGRVISDGISDAYIQDLIILPNHRRTCDHTDHTLSDDDGITHRDGDCFGTDGGPGQGLDIRSSRYFFYFEFIDFLLIAFFFPIDKFISSVYAFLVLLLFGFIEPCL